MHTFFPKTKNICNRLQVQGSPFRVKGKEGTEDPKSSLNMVIFQSNCQFGSKFWISNLNTLKTLLFNKVIFCFEVSLKNVREKLDKKLKRK